MRNIQTSFRIISLSLLTFAFSTPTALGQSFGDQQVISTSGNEADVVLAGDLDNDGDLDVISSSRADDKVAWYENLGGGTFGPEQTISTQIDFVEDIYTVDFDQDGDIDVLSASVHDNAIYLHENQGGGTFNPESLLTTDVNSPQCIRAADIDQDGDLDLLTADANNNGVAWHENIGGSTFTRMGLNSDAPVSVSVIAEDFDGDGDLDVLACHRDATGSQTGNGTVYFFDGLGGGSFGTKQVLGQQDGPMSISAADLDLDGDLDAIAASVYSGAPTLGGELAWYEYLGNGVFGKKQVITTEAIGARGICSADLDNDGDFDVLSASEGDDQVAWYENFGAGTFGAKSVISNDADDAICVYATDLDSDGDIDILSASQGDNKIAWYENIGVDCNNNGIEDSLDSDCDADGTPDDCQGLLDCDLNGVPDLCEILADPSLDTNGDGRLDGCHINVQADWIQSPINGHWYAVDHRVTPWSEGRQLAESVGGNLVTIRSQAEQDWIRSALDPYGQDFGPVAGLSIGLYQQPGGTEPAGGWVWSSGNSSAFRNWSTGEPNNDTGGSSNENIALMHMFDHPTISDGSWNDGGDVGAYRPLLEVPSNPHVGWSWPRSTPSGVTPCYGAQGDFDGDGDLDFAVADIMNQIDPSLNDQILLHWNDGEGHFSPASVLSIPPDPYALIALDHDQDSDLDLVVACRSAGLYLSNNTAGLFSPATLIETGEFTSVQQADFDRDGIDDLIAITRNPSSIRTYQGKPGGGFADPQSITWSGAWPNYLTVGDIDGDGDTDAIFCEDSTSTGSVEILINDGSGALNFKPSSGIAANRPFTTSLADLDGDLDLDLCVPQLGDNLLSVWLNDGTGSFVHSADYPAGTGPHDSNLADFDSDGDFDIVVPSYASDEVRIFWNDGNANFPESSTFTGHDYACACQVGDLDGNLSPDLIVSRRASSDLVTWLNNYPVDCNGNGFADWDDIDSGISLDCDSNGIPDECEFVDCDFDGISDNCTIANGDKPDCNLNGVPDFCDVAYFTSEDCNGNLIPDECEPDCDGNGVPDVCDPSIPDCDSDGVPDGCETDCNLNSIPDDCELVGNDCNSSGVPDDCELSDNDCDRNGVPDECDTDCNADGTPDDCQALDDCNADDTPDECQTLGDCNKDGTPDECQGLEDCDSNGVPDECEAMNDCNANDIPDRCEEDCDSDGLPDDCEVDCNEDGVADDCQSLDDCDGNGAPDACEPMDDCNGNGVPDRCENDCDDDGLPDDCEVDDCNSDGVPDDCQSLDDCDADGTPDICQVFDDCNGNGWPDECDTFPGGGSDDVNSNSIPDECECIASWFCSTSPNSVGPGALIDYEGTLSVGLNNLTLKASGGPAGQPGLFYYGSTQINGGNGVPFGQGLRCVGGGGQPTFRVEGPAFFNASGEASKPIDLTFGAMGSGPGAVQEGSVYNFQLWYRDPAGGPPGLNFNFSDAVQLTFCP